jgi:hypothetical protein
LAETCSVFFGVKGPPVADVEANTAPPLTPRPAPSPKTFIYTSLAERRITLHEEQVAVQAGSTGLRTWTAALHFAHHFLSDPVALFGRNVSAVVELGAGTGFLSAVLALEGVDVIATDLGDGNEDGHVEAWDDEGGNTRQTPLGRLTANLITSESRVMCPASCVHVLPR